MSIFGDWTSDRVVDAAALSNAAYAGRPIPAGWHALTPGQLALDGSHFKLVNGVNYFHGDSVFGAQADALVLISTAGELAVSFRGTDDVSDIASWPGVFENIYVDAFDRLLDAVADYARSNSVDPAKILVVGHSLGAVAVNQLRSISDDAYGGLFEAGRYISFGTPLVAGSHDILNIGHENDPVFKLVSPGDHGSTTDNIIYFDSVYSSGVRSWISSHYIGNDPPNQTTPGPYQITVERISQSLFDSLGVTQPDTVVVIDAVGTVPGLGAFPSDPFGRSALVLGEPRADELWGGPRSDWIEGFGGDDVLRGFGDVDHFSGGPGNDSLYGGSGLDWACYDNAGAGTVVNLTDLPIGLLPAHSVQDGEGGIDTIFSVERFTGSASADTFFGAAGNDGFEGRRGDDVVDGGAGFDLVSYLADPQRVLVNLGVQPVAAGTNVLQPSQGADGYGGIDTLLRIEGVDGSAHDDIIAGSGAYNRLYGNPGDDQLIGGLGNDVLDGGDGTDALSGDDGNDSVLGALGNDRLDGSFGNDRLDGGSGVDIATYYGTASVTVSLALAGAQDTGRFGIDTLAGIENLSGGSGADKLTGDALANMLFGGDGDDTMAGGGSKDLLTGSGGLDRSIFTSLADSGPSFAARDVVNTFAHGDRIDLAALDASSNVPGNQAFSFVDHFTGTAGQLQWDQTAPTGYLIAGDVNGDGTADFSLQIYAAPGFGAILASDFIL